MSRSERRLRARFTEVLTAMLVACNDNQLHDLRAYLLKAGAELGLLIEVER
jgi:hypothetical protein